MGDEPCKCGDGKATSMYCIMLLLCYLPNVALNVMLHVLSGYVPLCLHAAVQHGFPVLVYIFVAVDGTRLDLCTCIYICIYNSAMIIALHGG